MSGGGREGTAGTPGARPGRAGSAGVRAARWGAAPHLLLSTDRGEEGAQDPPSSSSAASSSSQLCLSHCPSLQPPGTTLRRRPRLYVTRRPPSPPVQREEPRFQRCRCREVGEAAAGVPQALPPSACPTEGGPSRVLALRVTASPAPSAEAGGGGEPGARGRWECGRRR